MIYNLTLQKVFATALIWLYFHYGSFRENVQTLYFFKRKIVKEKKRLSVKNKYIM